MSLSLPRTVDIELIQFASHSRGGPMSFQQQVTDAVDNAQAFGAQVNTEVGAIELLGFAIGIIKDVCR